MRSTAEWEALLDGWVYDKQSDTLLGAWVRSTQIRKQEQAAPEAVAEAVRLRRELETLRRDMRRQPSNALASEVGNAITIILEGTNE